MTHIKGRVARQAHVGVPEGMFEEEHGRKGFFGRSSELYHLYPPTAWSRIEGPLRPRCFDAAKAPAHDYSDPAAGPLSLIENDEAAVLISRRSEPMPYFFRYADGDEIYFIHRGRGVCETDYGPLEFEPGDYLHLPKG